MKNLYLIVLFIAAIILIGLGPLLTLWSLSTLFGLGLALNIYTWLAAAWFHWILFGQRAIEQAKKINSSK